MSTTIPWIPVTTTLGTHLVTMDSYEVLSLIFLGMLTTSVTRCN